MKSLSDLDYDELHARAVQAARLPALDGDGGNYAGLDVLDAETGSGYGQVAVTSDEWLRKRANLYLSGLPDAPRPVDALRRLTDDEREIVLVEALREIDFECRHLRAFDPGKHKRWPKGHPSAGKFRPMIDLLKAAIAAFDPKKDEHPFELFDRPQLMDAAKDRGIKLEVGEDKDSIAAKLLADLDPPTKASREPRMPSSRDTVKDGDFSGLKKVGGRRGSNPAGVYEADDGSKWYVKEQKSLDHARNEALASSLYRAALYEGPQVFVGKGAPGMDGPQTASEWLDTQGPIDLSDERQMSDVRFGFAVDAWLANWDVAGLSMDNIEVQGGFPVRVDSGGALLYRAQGGGKGAAFGDTVTEWDTLRDPKKAPQASRLFAGMSRDELIESAGMVENVGKQRIRELVAEHDMPEGLADRLIARREDIIGKVERLQLEAEAERGDDRIDGALANRHALAAAPSRLPDRDPGAADLEAELTFTDDPGWSERTRQASSRAVRFYRNSTYRQIGAYLREDGDSTMAIQERPGDPATTEDLGLHVALIDQVMERSQLKEPVLVWRGVARGKEVFGDKWSDDMVGVEWDEQSFPSTSADPDIGRIFSTRDGALMRWHVPAGVGAIRLDGWKSRSKNNGEAELLLNRNLRARIVSDSLVDGRRVFDVEITPIAEDDPFLARSFMRARKSSTSHSDASTTPRRTPGVERMTMGYPVAARIARRPETSTTVTKS